MVIVEICVFGGRGKEEMHVCMESLLSLILLKLSVSYLRGLCAKS